MTGVRRSDANSWGMIVGRGLLYATTATTLLALVHKTLPSRVRNNLPTDPLKSSSLANRVLKVSLPTLTVTAAFTYYQSRAAAFSNSNPTQPNEPRKKEGSGSVFSNPGT